MLLSVFVTLYGRGSTQWMMTSFIKKREFVEEVQPYTTNKKN